MVNSAVAEEDALFQNLAREGSELLKLFDAERAIQPKHISIIRGWINQALDLIEIELALPPDSTEFVRLCELRKTYSTVTSILPGDTSEHILQVLECLKTAYKYFKALSGFDWSQIAPEERTGMCYSALAETWQFSRKKLIGSLKGKEDGRTKRTALLHSYGNMYCWVHGMVKLGAKSDEGDDIAEHCHTLAGCLRAVLEIFLDINLLAKEIVDNAAEKFFSFQKIEKSRVARNLLKLDTESEHLKKEQREKIQKYVDSGSCEADDICIVNLWGCTKKDKPKRVRHWTAMTVVERAKAMGKESLQFYQQIYHYCNWSLHSGYSVFPASKEVALLFAAHVCLKANEMFLRSTKLLIEELPFLNAAELASELRKVQSRGAHPWCEAMVKAQRLKDEIGKSKP
jgi:hypothetical protein